MASPYSADVAVLGVFTEMAELLVPSFPFTVPYALKKYCVSVASQDTVTECDVPLDDSEASEEREFGSVPYATDQRESTSVAKATTNPVPVNCDAETLETAGVLVTVTFTVVTWPTESVADASNVESPEGSDRVFVQFPFERGMDCPQMVNMANPPVSETFPVRTICEPSAVPPSACEVIESAGEVVSTVTKAFAEVDTPARSVKATYAVFDPSPAERSRVMSVLEPPVRVPVYVPTTSPVIS